MFRSFLKKNKSSIVFTGDVGIFFVSLVLTLLIRYEPENLIENLNLHLRPFGILLLLWVFVFYAVDLYSYQSWKKTTQNIRKFLIAFLLNFFLSISIFYIFGEFFKVAPKSNFILFTIIFGILDSAWRLYVAKMLASRNNNKTLAVYSSSPLTQEIIEHCKKHPQLGYTAETYTNIESIKTKILEQKNNIIILVDSSTLKENETVKTFYGFYLSP